MGLSRLQPPNTDQTIALILTAAARKRFNFSASSASSTESIAFEIWSCAALNSSLPRARSIKLMSRKIVILSRTSCPILVCCSNLRAFTTMGRDRTAALQKFVKEGSLPSLVSIDMNGPSRTLVAFAANGGFEPLLPIFCNAANGHFN